MDNLIVKQRILKNMLNTTELTRESVRFNKRIEELKKTGEELENVKGIGKATVKLLYDNGIRTTEQLKAVTEDYLRTIIRNPLAIQGVLIYLNNEKELCNSEQSKTQD